VRQELVVSGSIEADAPRAVIFGCGFVGLALARALVAQGWQVAGTARSGAALQAITGAGAQALALEDSALGAWLVAPALVLGSIPPGEAGDPALVRWGEAMAQAPPAWAGYLSTTGVYGDRGGRWAFEEDTPTPLSPEATRRTAAEASWRTPPLAAHVFRLPGIYGPGRSALDQLRAGTARSIDKPGQIFSRIHRDDIVSAVLASLARPNPGRIYNLCDDEPAPSWRVTEGAARMLGLPAPPRVPIAQAGLSPMGVRFYAECKRVSNARAKAELGWRPACPTWREGLAAILAGEGAAL
jgi:nucleoside-diphosphate-sugar epimerase